MHTKSTLLLLCLAACANVDPPITSLDECTADVRIPIEEPFELDRFYQLMDFTNDELGLRMRIALSPGPINLPTGLAINYYTRRLALESSGGVTCIQDEAQLDYELTLHNDNDSVTAMVSPDERYVVLMVYDFDTSSFTDTLTIEHPQSGDPSDGPYPLTEAGCSVHREDGVSDCTYQARPPR